MNFILNIVLAIAFIASIVSLFVGLDGKGKVTLSFQKKRLVIVLVVIILIVLKMCIQVVPANSVGIRYNAINGTNFQKDGKL